MENKILIKKTRLSGSVTETRRQLLNRRQLLKKFLFAPGIMFMHGITQKRAGANVVSGPVSNPGNIYVANHATQTANVFTPNEPMGIAQGIFPGQSILDLESCIYESTMHQHLNLT